ncbi:hypothetical protein AGOR_G00206550 [Albula goreensis]|uniref:Jacalin-type lectin domain-containing protein n=1 Tax=Albula goreensis TaxID=1534307 RepID=A0A8T3CKT2_9TELE|nr:hypothetical protein AGOR_G00206550 [Albula goreensis]
MKFALVFSLCFITACAQHQPQFYSFSPTVGRGLGTSFASSGEGRITAVRVWENSGSYIRAFQLRYDYAWTQIYGRNNGEEQELVLYDEEAIVQISGKYSTSNFIYQLIFVTSRGRILMAGQPVGTSFNFYPEHSHCELLLISGRADYNGLTAIAAHWGMVYPANGNNTMMVH